MDLEGFGLPAADVHQSSVRVTTSRGTAIAEFSADRDLLVDLLNVKLLIESMMSAIELESAGDGRAWQRYGLGLSKQNAAQLTADADKKVLGASPYFCSIHLRVSRIV
mgnify:CR=1 FL=1